MPCDTKLREEQTKAERKKQITAALARLERYLQTGSVRVVVSPRGALAFAGWKDRDDVSDVCAIRAISKTPAYRMALARAEALAGVKADEKQVAAGTHSHDGGKTWHPGH